MAPRGVRALCERQTPELNCEADAGVSHEESSIWAARIVATLH
jgi:hypothetical protein